MEDEIPKDWKEGVIGKIFKNGQSVKTIKELLQ